jgi:hypothetical protein
MDGHGTEPTAMAHTERGHQLAQRRTLLQRKL